MSRERGFVLVNALVLVAALSAVALWLLSRAENGRVRSGAMLGAVQLELNLDAYENLARALINQDPGATDHGDDIWARSDLALPLDRGQVAGQIVDLQGRFNVNWLANAEEEQAQIAFDNLLTRLGVSSQTGTRIMAALLPDGEALQGREGELEQNPPSGPALLLDQLPVSPRAMERLAPHIAVLPASSRLNVNTVSSIVLASFLPGSNPAALDSVLRTRETEPFASVDEFVNEMVRVMGADIAAELDTDRLSVGSLWFGVSIRAALDGQIASRELVLKRMPLPEGARVAYRQDGW